MSNTIKIGKDKTKWPKYIALMNKINEVENVNIIII